MDVFDNLKLRLGWGKTGAQTISAYSTLSKYNTGNYVNADNSNNISNSLAGIANPDLTWESTSQFNFGIDMGVIDNRLTATFDTYSKITKDLLQNLNIGLSNGFTTMPVNLGEISNKGAELTLNFMAVNKKDFAFEFGGNFAINRNKIEKLGLEPTTVWINEEAQDASYYFGNNVSSGMFKQSANIFMEGQPIGMFWGFETNGIYQTEEEAANGPAFNGTANVAGDVVILDQNDDGNIDESDKTFIGNPNPDFTYGLNFSLRFKRWSLSALFDGVYGNEIVNANLSQVGYPTLYGLNALSTPYLEAWRENAPSKVYPRIGWTYSESQFTDLMVEDGSYFRLNNITLEYEVPVQKIGLVRSLSVYASANNLFTITNYSGYDPVVTSYMYDGSILGVDWLGSPNVRNFLIGVNMNF